MKSNVFLFAIYTMTIISICVGSAYSEQVSAAEDKLVKTATDFNKGNFTSGYTLKDINKVLEKFKSSFVAGDIDGFMSLFDVNVRTEDGDTRAVLRKEYTELFNSTDKRKIRLNNASWQEDDSGVISGDIDFVLNIRSRIDGKISRFSGIMRMYFKKQNEDLVINGLFHAYDENTSIPGTEAGADF